MKTTTAFAPWVLSVALLLGGCMFMTGGGDGDLWDGPGEPDDEEPDETEETPDETDDPPPDETDDPPPDETDDPPPDDPPPDDPPPDDPPPDDPPCVYPTGPYGFGAGATVRPMSWPGAIPGARETGNAIFEELACHGGVESVFLLITNHT